MCIKEGEGWGGVAVLLRDGLTYRERPDLGTFDEGVFESVFVEIVRGGGRRNDIDLCATLVLSRAAVRCLGNSRFIFGEL